MSLQHARAEVVESRRARERLEAEVARRQKVAKQLQGQLLRAMRELAASKQLQQELQAELAQAQAEVAELLQQERRVALVETIRAHAPHAAEVLPFLSLPSAPTLHCSSAL